MTDPHEDDLEIVADFFASEDDMWEIDNKGPVVDHDEHYQDKRFLAAGGMKEIYEVYDPKTRRKVAMAELKKDGPLWHCESFLEEAHLTASLVHPNIITVHTVGVRDDGSPYFTMELKIGHTLGELVNIASDKTELLAVFLKVCDAVSYAHSVGVLHLDIKPDNIQVGEHGLVKLCDWGLACRVAELSEKADLVRGTPGFMSPEQIHRGELGCHTDIYSLGALLCFILTGVPPFEGGLDTMLTNTVKGNFESLSERDVPLDISSSLDAVVKRAMEMDPEERYGSVDALKADVTKFMSGYSTSAENAGLLKECILLYRRNKVSCWIASTLLIILVLTASAFVHNLTQSKNRIEQSLIELEKAHKNLQNAKQKEKEAYLQSEENYEKFIAQKEAQIRASAELKVKKLKEAQAAVLYPNYFLDPVQAIDKSLRILRRHLENESDEEIEQQVIMNLFISQQFDQIANYSPTYTAPLVEIAAEYADLETTPGGILGPDDFVRLLQMLNARLQTKYRELNDSVFERMVYYHKAKNHETNIDLDVLAELLKSLNPKWIMRRYEYNDNQKRLIISGKGLTDISGDMKYNSRKCVLSLINLQTLVLRKTDISIPAQLSGLNVNRVEIRDTEISSIYPVSAFSGISTLIVHEGQIPEEMWKDAPPTLEILVK